MGIVDPTFAVNDFNEPKILTKRETYIYNFLTLLYGKPGFHPSIPNIGINISQYLFLRPEEISVEALKSQISDQCSDFLPIIKEGDFDIIKTTYGGNVLLIFKLPDIDDVPGNYLALGVTTNDSGDVVFRFVENKYQMI